MVVAAQMRPKIGLFGGETHQTSSRNALEGETNVSLSWLLVGKFAMCFYTPLQDGKAFKGGNMHLHYFCYLWPFLPLRGVYDVSVLHMSGPARGRGVARS